MSKTEISAKILKSFKPNMKQIDETVQAVACAIGFWRPSWILLKKLKNAKKIILPGNSPGPVCILQIFGNNPSRGFRVRAETSGGTAAAAGGPSKNNKSPPPHSGWRLNNIPHMHFF